jgi:hypothetical protein
MFAPFAFCRSCLGYETARGRPKRNGDNPLRATARLPQTPLFRGGEKAR